MHSDIIGKGDYIMTIPNQILQFAGESNLGVYRMFADYWNHYRFQNEGKKVEFQATRFDKETGTNVPVTLEEKGEMLNKELRREILRVAGISNFEAFPLETWASHPVLSWASFAVISAMIDMVLPDTVIENTGMYSDVRTIGWGDSASFDVKPRDLFVVSKVGKGKRTTQLNKQYNGQVTVIPEAREMTVFVSLMKVLAGKESLAEFVAKMVQSFETQFAYDVYNAFYAAMDAVDATASTGLKVAGYSQSEFIRLSQTVSAWNGGAKPIAIGTQVALGSILPSNANYRYDIESDFVKIGYLRNFQGTDIMVLPQIADWTTPFGLKLTNSRIWFVSPSSQKIVKVVLEGSTLAYGRDFYEHANLLQTSTIMKSWGTAIATSAVAATMTL